MADEEASPATATVDKETLKEALSEILADTPIFKALTSTGKGKEDPARGKRRTRRLRLAAPEVSERYTRGR